MLLAGLYGLMLVANPLEKPAGDSRCRHESDLQQTLHKQRLNENERPNPVAQHFSRDGRSVL